MTIVDLLTKVAGVPSFLFLTAKILLHHFEKFYTDIKIYKSFLPKQENHGSYTKPDEKDKHLTLEQRNKLRIIQRQGPVASHTFCVRSSLPQKDRDLLKKTLIRISQEEPNLSQSLFGGTLIGVDPIEHLKAPREAKKVVSTLEN